MGQRRTMIRINVSQQLKSDIGYRCSYKVEGTVAVAVGDSPVEGKAVLVRTDRGILVEARLRTSVELTCSRCLTPFRYPITLNITEEYLPTADIVVGLPFPCRTSRGALPSIRTTCCLWLKTSASMSCWRCP